MIGPGFSEGKWMERWLRRYRAGIMPNVSRIDKMASANCPVLAGNGAHSAAPPPACKSLKFLVFYAAVRISDFIIPMGSIVAVIEGFF